VFVDYHRSVLTLLSWQWRAVLTYAGVAAVVVAIHRLAAQEWFAIPALPLTVLGAAIGIFVSFRTNSCYDRWWEGRRMWGQLVNTSRHFASQVLGYVDASGSGVRDLQEEIVRRHVAYVHALRCSLREENLLRDPDVARYLDAAELAALTDEPNPNHRLLHRQIRAIATLARVGAIDGLRLQLLDRSISVLLDVQGGCERIKKTPFPQSYSFVATKLIGIYSALLPLGMVASAGWVAVPVSVLVCLAFRLIDEVGDALEDPFSMQPLALPLQAIATAIEIDLGKRLGDPALPEPKTPDEGVLM
jgi:ion channel-forming bestrophin family protein